MGVQVESRHLVSNTFDYANVYTLKKVNFWETVGIFGFEDWVQIMSDADPNIAISGTDNFTAWENGQKKDTIAYVSDSKSQVEAEFIISCNAGSGQVLYTRATYADGYNFPSRPLMLNNGLYRYPKTSYDKKFDKEVVSYCKNFALKWQICYNANGPWIDVETSKNYI